MNLRRVIIILGIVILFAPGLFSQNGVILLDSLNLKVVKIWGTHQQRGYAYGYLLGADFNQVINNYVKPVFGSNYLAARNIIIAGNDLQIDVKYQNESQGIIDGMNAAGVNTTGLDATDVLVGNCLLDLMGLLGMKSGMGCSSLMSWGDATIGSPLMGKSVLSRHLDWQINSTLVNNQVLIIHQPSEPGEQNWLLAGFAGMIAALSGMNTDLGVFQHVMEDYNGNSSHNMQYKPIWFAMRDALENTDYNNDGNCNVGDLRASVNDSPNGLAAACIISALSRTVMNDSLVAMVAEITPTAPTHVYRSNNFPDSIPGDNLYTANSQIARNNALHFCTRYNAIRSHIGNGTQIGLTENWELMRDWSHTSSNLQFLQFSPEQNHLKIAVRKTQPAYLSDFLVFDLNQLLNQVVGITRQEPEQKFTLHPNPATDIIHVEGLQHLRSAEKIEIHDILGRCLYSADIKQGSDQLSVSISCFKKGIYLLSVQTPDGNKRLEFIKK